MGVALRAWRASGAMIDRRWMMRARDGWRGLGMGLVRAEGGDAAAAAATADSVRKGYSEQGALAWDSDNKRGLITNGD